MFVCVNLQQKVHSVAITGSILFAKSNLCTAEAELDGRLHDSGNR